MPKLFFDACPKPARAVLLACLLWPSLVAAQAGEPGAAAGGGERIRLEFFGADFRPLPIAVPALRAQSGGAPAEAAAKLIGEVLRRDFGISGLFQVLDPRSFTADAKKEGLSTPTIDFPAWVNVGAEALVKGGVKLVAGTYRIEMRLFEVGPAREALSKSYEVSEGDLRTAAHQFGDAVVAFFTGQPGIFQTRILSVRGNGDAKEIYIMDFDGARMKRLTRNKNLDLFPAWTPDGKGFAHTSFAAGKPDIYLRTLGSSKARVLAKAPGLNIGAAFKPDGSKVALTQSPDGNTEIYVVNPDGSGRTRLTNSWGIDTSPSWSPDGKRIAFASSRTGSTHIYTMAADGSDVRRLTYEGNNNTEPEWSPRGDQIVFTARDERRAFDLFVVDPESGKISRLTQDQGHNKEPTWSPDGRHLAFTSNRDGSWQVYVMNADGTNQRRITPDKSPDWSTPAWSPFLE